MPTYHYMSDVLLSDIKDDSRLKGYELYIEDPDNLENCRLIWVVNHSIYDDPVIMCPITGKPAIRTLVGCEPAEVYVKGYGMARDKAGARRDMNRHTLETADPYAKLRQPGEKDDMINRLKKAGKAGNDRRYYAV